MVAIPSKSTSNQLLIQDIFEGAALTNGLRNGSDTDFATKA